MPFSVISVINLPCCIVYWKQLIDYHGFYCDDTLFNDTLFNDTPFNDTPFNGTPFRDDIFLGAQ